MIKMQLNDILEQKTIRIINLYVIWVNRKKTPMGDIKRDFKIKRMISNSIILYN